MDGITLVTTITAVISVSNYFFYKLYSIKVNSIEKRIEKIENKIEDLTERMARLEALINKNAIKK